MTQPDAPKIEFPCADYPIKVIGRNEVGFQKLVIDIIRTHAPDVAHRSEDAQISRNARFISVRCKITATGTDQLRAIHEALMATGVVQMVI